MGWKPAFVVIALLGASACASEVIVRDIYPGPGGLMTTENTGMVWAEGFGNNAAVEHWRRLRVIVPAGATLCRSTAWLEVRNPHDNGEPDAEGVVMLTVRDGQDAHLSCDTSSGTIERTVKAVKWEWIGQGSPRGPTMHEVHWVLPPLVHMQPGDPKAAERWAALDAEICADQKPKGRLECRLGMMERLKAADLG